MKKKKFEIEEDEEQYEELENWEDLDLANTLLCERIRTKKTLEKWKQPETHLENNLSNLRKDAKT